MVCLLICDMSRGFLEKLSLYRNFLCTAGNKALENLLNVNFVFAHFGLNSLISILSFGEIFSYFAMSWK